MAWLEEAIRWLKMKVWTLVSTSFRAPKAWNRAKETMRMGTRVRMVVNAKAAALW